MRIIKISCMLLALTCVGFCGTLDLNPAFDVILSQAKRGDVESQCIIADRYFMGGGGVEVNPNEACKWYELAIKGGSARARFRLATILLNGHLIPSDNKRAILLMKEAAAANFPLAQKSMGDKYLFGHFVQKDYDLARKWFLLASNAGVAGAEHQLGFMAENGRGCPVDLGLAYLHYRTAQELITIDAAKEIELAHVRRVSLNLSKEVVSELEKKVLSRLHEVSDAADRSSPKINTSVKEINKHNANGDLDQPEQSAAKQPASPARQ